jgi:hypothetical protein
VLSEFFSEINTLSSEKNPLKSLRVRLPNAPQNSVMWHWLCIVVNDRLSVDQLLWNSVWEKLEVPFYLYPSEFTRFVVSLMREPKDSRGTVREQFCFVTVL